MRRLVIALLLFASLSARAQESEVYYYQGLDRSAAKAHFEAVLGRTIPDESLVAIPNVALPVDDDIWFLGAPEGQKCDPAVRATVDEVTGGDDAFDLLLGMAQADLDELNYGAAREGFELIARAIPCARESINRATLSRIFLYFGINAVYAGDIESGRGFFRQSVQLSGRPLWDPSYPPLAEDVYNDSSSEVEAYGRIDLAYWLPGLDLEALYVDGEPIVIDEDVRGSLRVLPGMHVLQWRRFGAELQTRIVTVPEWAQLVSTRGLQVLLALRPEIGKGTSVGRAQESLLVRAGATSVLVADPETGEPEFSYSYTGREDGEAGLVRYHAGARIDRTFRQVEIKAYKPVELRLGGGYVLGTSVTGTLVADFWLPPPRGTRNLSASLALEFGADAAFTGIIGFSETAIAIMPSLRFGIRLEFRPERPVKPYTFALARVSFSSNPSAMAGPILGVGVTMMFPSEHPRLRAFGFWVEAMGGPMFSSDRPRGTFALLAGLTIRPYVLRE